MQANQQFRQEPAPYLGGYVLKDAFKVILRMIGEWGSSSLLDVGCASGGLLHFLPPGVRGTGVDVCAELIEEAKQRNKDRPDLAFVAGDVLDDATRARLAGPFDVVTMLGVVNTFFDFRPLFERVLGLPGLKHLIALSPFNSRPVDVRHSHRDVSRGEQEYQCAYSVFSHVSVARYLDGKGVKYGFRPFEMSASLSEDPENLTRNFHVTLTNGERYLTNGMGMLFKEYFLVVDL